MTKDQEGEKSNLNKSDDLQINRGFELMLRHNRRDSPSKPKIFSYNFGKMISLFNREILINFSLDITKK
jgi:hypothetical protein